MVLPHFRLPESGSSSPIIISNNAVMARGLSLTTAALSVRFSTKLT